MCWHCLHFENYFTDNEYSVQVFISSSTAENGISDPGRLKYIFY